MQDSIEIVRAQPADVRALIGLNEAVQRLHAAHEPTRFVSDPDPEEVASYFTQLFESPDRFIDIASVEGEPAGYIVYELRSMAEVVFKHPMQLLYIHQIATARRFRRCGVGRALLAAVEDFARARGIDRIELDSYAFNREAHRFFESAGFSTFKIVMDRRLEP
ncbi:MAG: GNAT family N-acetyltransferase [Acidobacteriota bacterium]